MALQPDIKTVPLFGGIDTKTDPKYVTTDNLLTADNVQFFGVNRAHKRYGQTALPRTIANAHANITTGKAIGGFGNELLMYDGNTVYAYGAAASSWVSRGALTEVSIARTPIVRSSGSVSGVASASASNVEVYAWEDSRGGVYYCMRDAASGSMIVPNAQLNSNASRPQVVVCGTSIFILYVATQSVYAAQFQTANLGGGIVQTQLLCSTVSANGAFCVAATATRLLLAWQTSATAWASTIFDTGLNVLASSTFSAGTSTGIHAQLAYSTDASTALLTIADTTAPALRFVTINTTTAAGTVGTPIVTAGTNCAAVGISTSAFRVFWDTGYASSMPALNACTVTAGVGGTVVSQFGLTLAGQPVFSGSSVYVLGCSALTNLVGGATQEPSFYLCDTNTAILQRFSASSAYTAGTVLPPLQLLSDGRLFVGLAERTQLRADATGTVYTQAGLTAAYFTFPSASNFKVVSFGTAAVISCGNTYSYDGSSIVESGFWEFPDGFGHSVATGGNLNGGIYTYVVTYEWQDAAGNTHYSAPSYPLVLGTLTAPIAAGGKISLAIPYTALTRKTGVTVNIYRTATAPGAPAGTDTGLGPWFKVGSVPNLTDGTAFVTFVDNVSDADAQGQQFLYAPPDGTGELENFAPPPFAFMVATKTRVFGIAQDDRTALWYSKPLALGRPAEFSPLQIVRIESDGGLPTALSYIDAQAVIFKSRRIYFLDGDGPTSQGGGSFFPSPRQISSTSGCSSQPSILSMHDGVFYKSETGLQLLSRSLSVNPAIGLPVQGFNALTLTGALSVPDQNQLRWVSSNGTALIYDYTTQRWYTYSGYASVGYAEWNGTYARLRADGTVFYEDQTTYLDAGAPVTMTIETSWIKPAQLAQGYAAVWYAQILGEYIDTHNLTVEIAYDYTDVAAHIVTFSPTGNINTSVFGSDSTYGAGTVYGANASNPSTNYQTRIALARQTCEAVKFKIYDTSVTGASCDLNEIALQLGVIGGLNRTTASRQV